MNWIKKILVDDVNYLSTLNFENIKRRNELLAKFWNWKGYSYLKRLFLPQPPLIIKTKTPFFSQNEFR